MSIIPVITKSSLSTREDGEAKKSRLFSGLPVVDEEALQVAAVEEKWREYCHSLPPEDAEMAHSIRQDFL